MLNRTDKVKVTARTIINKPEIFHKEYLVGQMTKTLVSHYHIMGNN